MKRCHNKNCPYPNPQPPENFNKSSNSFDGKQPYCRLCQRDSNKRRGKQGQRYPKDLLNAYRRLRHAVKTGKVIKEPCKVCGEPNVLAYLAKADSTPKWYCRVHHPKATGNPHAKDLVVDEQISHQL